MVATYSITDARKEKVSFAGPYFITGQGLLVAADNEDITGVDTLEGATVCSATGSTSIQRIKDEHPEVTATIIPVSSPGYGGSQYEGFFRALHAVVRQVPMNPTPNGRVNIITGHLSAADTRALKALLDASGLDYVLLPDLSQNLDGGHEETYNRLPQHGTTLEDISLMAGARITLELAPFCPEEYSPGAYLREAHGVPLLRMGLPPAIELAIDAPADLPPMLADPAQVEQALFNLTNNAIHAIHNSMHSGGKITIRARLALPDLGLVQRFDLQPDNYIALTVQDNGPGMDAATQERIFEPFFTTKPVGQGTGLGLAVVHGLMRTHEGAVEVHSHPGQGCTFTLYFPLLPASTAAIFTAPRLQRVKPLESAALPVTLHSAPQMQHRVMYVDDDAAMVHLVQRLLRRRGYQITTFEDPRAAVQALHATPHAFDLVVTDYNMPGYCGLDLLKAAQSIRPDLPVALASGYVTSEISEQALAAGALALIHKPNDVSELCAIVDQLLHPNTHATTDWHER